MRLLDLFCGAGGAAEGYSRAGFTTIIGVDLEPQPHYPFGFVQGDALDVLREWGSAFDGIHASPPCQVYSRATRTAPPRRDGREREHRDLLTPIRPMLKRVGRPYVIENVPDAAPLMESPIQLCGTSFLLPGLQRHRLFECSFPVLAPPCAHSRNHERRYVANRSGRITPARVVSVAGRGGTSTPGHGGKASIEDWRAAMGIDWMNRDELAQAIPPAYTEFLGGHLLAAVEREV